MTTSTTYDDRAAVQREVRGSGWFASQSPTTGRDESTGLELEVDATGWPLKVVRLDAVPTELRTAEGLRSALERAISAATLEHLVENARAKRLSESELARGRELIEGRRRLVPPPAFRAGPVTRPDGPVSVPRSLADERLGRVAVGVSREGEIRVELGWVDGLRALEADPRFLAEAPPDLLRHALNEAFGAAQEGVHG